MHCAEQFLELKICISPQFRAIDPPNPAGGFIQQNENVRFATAACMQKYGNILYTSEVTVTLGLQGVSCAAMETQFYFWYRTVHNIKTCWFVAVIFTSQSGQGYQESISRYHRHTNPLIDSQTSTGPNIEPSGISLYPGYHLFYSHTSC